MRIDSSGRLLVGTTSAGYSGVDLTVGDTTDSQNGVGIQTSTTGYGYVLFGDGSGVDAYRGQISYKHGDDYMSMHTAGAERMRIDSSGNLLVGKTSDSNTANGVTARPDGGARFTSAGTSSFVQLAFFRNGSASEVGSITTTSSATAYNTSSDYRLKENVVEMTGALDRVNQLQPKRFNFIADETNTLVDGFLAHEVSDIVPEAVTGEKDGDRMQGIDQSKLVPLLTKAIQEQQTQIDALQSEINLLKGE